MNVGQFKEDKSNDKTKVSKPGSKFFEFFYKILEFLPFALLLLSFIVFRKKLSGILIPLFIGIVIAGILEPTVQKVYEKLENNFSKHFKINRKICVAVVFSLFVVILVFCISLFIYIFFSNVAEIVENSNGFQYKLMQYTDNLISDEHIEIKTKIKEIIDEMSLRLSNKGEEILSAASSFSTYSKISQVALGTVTSAVLAFYILRDKVLFKNWFLGIFPYRFRTSLEELADEVRNIISRFVQGQLLVAVLVGIIEAIGLVILDVPHSIFFGIIGGISNIIPYFGPFIGAVFPVLTAFMVSPFKAIWVIVLFLAVQQIDNHYITPKVIQGSLGIHPVTVIIMIYIGQELLGLWGILFAVPLYAILKCVFFRMIHFAFKDKSLKS